MVKTIDESKENFSDGSEEVQISENQLKKLQLRAEISKMRKEHESLGRDLDALKGTIERMKADHKERMRRTDDSIQLLKIAEENVRKRCQAHTITHHSQDEESSAQVPVSKKRKEISSVSDDDNCMKESEVVPSISSNEDCAKIALLICRLSALLTFLPFGASIDYICSTLLGDSTLDPDYVESVLKRYPSIFRQGVPGFSSFSKNWCYIHPKPSSQQ